jgi:hypothetical protein
MYGGANNEVMVRSNGLMSLVDYGWATSHGWQCTPGSKGQRAATYLHEHLVAWGTADVVVTHLLSQYEALRDDLGLDLGLCGASSVARKVSVYHALRRSAEHFWHLGSRSPPSECFNGTAGYFDITRAGSVRRLTDPGTGSGPGPGASRSPRASVRALPFRPRLTPLRPRSADKANLIDAFGSQLRQCHALCQSCPRCSAFTPSKITNKCHWSSTCSPLNGDSPAWHGSATPTFGRGAIQHKRPPPPKPSAALQAIINAPAGHCGKPHVLGNIDDCRKSKGNGGWHLRDLVGNLTETGPLAADGLTPDIVARCAAACAACPACAFFSINLYRDTCSWHRRCNLTGLSPTPRGYRTFIMPRWEEVASPPRREFRS